MAQYRFTGDQRQVFCDLQADDGSTLVVDPGQVVNVVNLPESLQGFFESVKGSKTAGKQAAAVKAAVTDTPPAPDPGAETPPAPDATEGKE